MKRGGGVGLWQRCGRGIALQLPARRYSSSADVIKQLPQLGRFRYKTAHHVQQLFDISEHDVTRFTKNLNFRRKKLLQRIECVFLYFRKIRHFL